MRSKQIRNVSKHGDSALDCLVLQHSDLALSPLADLVGAHQSVIGGYTCALVAVHCNRAKSILAGYLLFNSRQWDPAERNKLSDLDAPAIVGFPLDLIHKFGIN